ncbi:MAG: Mur ligase family protein, partial [Candidatus Limnocylindrales bacterium]
MSALLGDLAAVLRERGLLRSIVPAATPSDVHPAGVPVVEPSIRSVSLDSRTVEPGALFAAAPGELADGHAYLPDAVEHGAVAVLVETPVTSLGVPQLVVAATRPATAIAAAWVAGFPSRHLGVVGVTGTDGKTTASYLIRAVLEAAGRPTGMAGTVDVIVGGRSLGNDARTTTPEAPALQSALARMLEAGDGWAIIEASSHGLAQDRVAEIAWDVAVLTNVTEEHLEFHRSIEAYQAAKQRLFEALAISPANPDKGFGKTAVVNLDDPASPAFADAARTAGARVIGYGRAATAMIRLVDVNQAAERLHVEVGTPRWQGRLALRLPGRFNAHNALAAVGVGEALGLDPTVVRTALEGVAGVPGRMERIEAGQPFGVVVDYAHTADALAKVLDELAPVAAAGGGSLIAVFGSAGDRDRVKRPAMG